MSVRVRSPRTKSPGIFFSPKKYLGLVFMQVLLLMKAYRQVDPPQFHDAATEAELRVSLVGVRHFVAKFSDVLWH